MLGSDELDTVAYELAQKHSPGRAEGQGQRTAGYDELAWRVYLCGDDHHGGAANESRV